MNDPLPTPPVRVGVRVRVRVGNRLPDLCRVEELDSLVDRKVEDLSKLFVVGRVVLPEERVAPRPRANAYPRREALGLGECGGCTSCQCHSR